MVGFTCCFYKKEPLKKGHSRLVKTHNLGEDLSED